MALSRIEVAKEYVYLWDDDDDGVRYSRHASDWLRNVKYAGLGEICGVWCQDNWSAYEATNGLAEWRRLILDYVYEDCA